MDDEDIRTIWCGNLQDKVTEEILYELFLQGGPVQRVTIPKDRDGRQKTFGFVTYKHECSVPYALDLLEGTTLFNRPLNMKSRNNTLEKNNYSQQMHHQSQQQMQHQLHQQWQHQIMQQQQYQHNNMFDNRQQDMRNSLLEKQVLTGMTSLVSNSLSMLPSSMSYSSQNPMYSQNSKSLDNRSNRHRNNHHAYQDSNHYNHDRRNNRQEPYNRDYKSSHKSSSSRSRDHHENRRKYR